MGDVYLGEDTKLRRKVALKLLAGGLTKNEDRLRRFEQEAQDSWSRFVVPGLQFGKRPGNTVESSGCEAHLGRPSQPPSSETLGGGSNACL